MTDLLVCAVSSLPDNFQTIYICDWDCKNKAYGHKIHPRSYLSSETEYLN